VGSEGVALPAPSFDDYLGLLEVVEDFPIDYFFPEFAIETLAVSVFPRAARFDVESSHSYSFEPLAYGLVKRLSRANYVVGLWQAVAQYGCS
jgi:hypothetical protein